MTSPHLFSRDELMEMGLRSIGRNVRIDRSVRLFGAERMSFGDHVRIDPFCILSAGPDGIRVGRNVHIAAYCSLVGQAKIELEDFAGLSARVSIFSSTDDYSGGALTNPTVPAAFLNVRSAPVFLGRHVIIGAGSVILPGVTIGLGASVGALSLIRKDVDEYAIMAGNPAKQISTRADSLLQREAEYLAWEKAQDDHR
ncbi:acyltransferase [Azospirillum sp. Marseille-Q6669]